MYFPSKYFIFYQNYFFHNLEKITSGEGSAVNGSFIVAEAASVTAGSVYTYSVCPSGPEICRIRFDFTV